MNTRIELTVAELDEIALYTFQKINKYPKEFGKTVENYFDILFPNEISDYIMRREINRRGRENYERRELRRNSNGSLPESASSLDAEGGAT